MKSLPKNNEMEKAVLGSVLLDPSVCDMVFSELNPSCFFDRKNEIIYTAMLGLYLAKKWIDVITVASSLSDKEKDDIGGVVYLSTLSDEISTVALINDYVAELKSLSNRRKMINAGIDIVKTGHSDMETSVYIEKSRKSVLEISDHKASKRLSAISDISNQVYGDLLSNEEPKGLVKTGISAIDERFGGIWPGLVTLLAARPSMGKSALALNIMANAALAGKKVLFFSMEDVKWFVMARLFSRFADVDSKKISQRNLSIDEIKRIESKKTIIDCMPIKVDDTSSYTVDNIRGQLYSEIDKNGVDLVVIDHLLKVSGNGTNRYEKITDSIECLTRVLKDANIANIVLHQLNRENTKRQDTRPTLADLRGSGDIEQEVRVAWFLHRDAYYQKDKVDNGDAVLYVEKNSHGPTGAVPLKCNLSRMWFGDRDF